MPKDTDIPGFCVKQSSSWSNTRLQHTDLMSNPFSFSSFSHESEQTIFLQKQTLTRKLPVANCGLKGKTGNLHKPIPFLKLTGRSWKTGLLKRKVVSQAPFLKGELLVLGRVYGCFLKIGVPQNGWFTKENLIQNRWFGGPPIFGNTHITPSLFLDLCQNMPKIFHLPRSTRGTLPRKIGRGDGGENVREVVAVRFFVEPNITCWLL